MKAFFRNLRAGTHFERTKMFYVSKDGRRTVRGDNKIYIKLQIDVVAALPTTAELIAARANVAAPSKQVLNAVGLDGVVAAIEADEWVQIIG